MSIDSIKRGISGTILAFVVAIAAASCTGEDVTAPGGGDDGSDCYMKGGVMYCE